MIGVEQFAIQTAFGIPLHLGQQILAVAGPAVLTKGIAGNSLATVVIAKSERAFTPIAANTGAAPGPQAEDQPVRR
ncbi:hypothetical protein GCM10022222_50860 [Amycolatopsis ultiminotia]|uniref:Uncharacterized protein n=1 Tax=Amycolatopsis ultiminotia TaxID=543629 RepID=A0ABP6X4K7_9PSEU